MSNKEFLIQTKWFSLDKTSLYDKIINICFFTGEKVYDENGILQPYEKWKNKKRYYLRTDYMPVFHNKNYDTYTIEKVKFKADITFKCTNYSNGNSAQAIGIDVVIKNFYLFGTDGEILRNYSTLNIDHIIIQLGYFANFINIKKDSIKDLQDNFSKIDENKQYGITTFKINTINSIYTQGMPPNASLQILGFAGEVFYGENALMTSEYIINSANTSAITFKALKDMIISLVDNNNRDDEVLSLYNDFALSSSSENDIVSIKGLFSKEVIDRFKKVANKYYNINKSVSDVFEKFYGVKTPNDLLNIVNNNFSLNLKLTIDENNNIIFYSDDLSVEQIEKNVSAINTSLYRKGYTNKADVRTIYNYRLPCIYNITFSAVCEIQAPFFYWVNSYNEINFKTSYWTSDSVYYYANMDSKNNKFIAFQSKLEFATTQNQNKITISCIEQKETE